MSIDFNRGTNPKITITVNDITLVPTFTEDVTGSDVVRYSYVTIRRDPCSEAAIDATAGELQMTMDNTGEVTDANGNVFTITESTAELKLNRTYTQGMDCGQPYFLQFNLIDSEGNLFTVGAKPLPMKVLPNQAVFE